jgi:hypothetical protein
MVAAITLVANTGHVGTTVTVNGTGYTSGKTISIFTYGGVTPATNTVIGQVVALAGTFSGTFVVPAHSKGIVVVTAADSAPETASTNYTVTNALAVSPISGTEDITVTATGSGYTATDALTGITIGGVTPSDQTVTSQVVAANGSWSGTFVVPTLASGAQTVTATTAADTASATFTLGQAIAPDESGPAHGTSHASTTVTASLTTTSSPDFVVAVVAWEDTDSATVVVTDAVPLVWTARSEPQVYGNFKIQEWTAPAAATIAAKTVTATFSVAITGYAALSVCGFVNAINGFDTNPGLPQALVTNATTTSFSFPITTHLAPELLFGALVVVPQASVTAGTGWDALDAVNATDFELVTEYSLATLPVNGDLITWTAASHAYMTIGIGDALTGYRASNGPWTKVDIGAVVTNSNTAATEQGVGYWYNKTVSVSGTTVTSNRQIGGYNSVSNLVPLIGTTTSASPTVLTDTNLSLTINALKGAILTYTSGPAAGQSQGIASNTSDTITTGTFSPAPTVGGGDAFSVTGPETTLVESHTASQEPIVGANDYAANYWPGVGSKTVVASG